MPSEKLLPIFSFMFNKIFTAFHSFKFENYIGSNTADGEYLTDHIRRFELMTLNSAYTAMIKGESIEANVGVTKNHETIRSKKLFKSSDRTLNRNMARFNSQFKEPESIEQQFIRALESHPLFEIIKSESDGDIVIEKRIKLGKIPKDKNLSVDGKSSSLYKNQSKFNDVKRLKYRLPKRLIQKAKDYLEKNSEYYDTVKATKKELVSAIENDLIAYDYFESDFNDKSINFDDLNIISGNKAHNFIKVLYDINKNGKS
ncbi:hypothetical protein A2I98_13650 [Pseudoalteromonas agarivorans]|uniref:Uncharacterized protein n=3 Tax=Pseudoalteromonas TaxID=53246 RepID=A0ABR5VSV9_9GAMM|nr:hypothetical protein [Pseudoalteromonas telluritireducens]KYL33371.1 hypothetical protein A2I98_13650 [Pseudoalteromonas telluritireducens]